MGKVSIKYLIKEGFRSLWTNRMMSFASIAVLMSCLILIGSAAMMFVNIESVLNKIEGQNVIMVFAEEGTTAEELTTIQDEIKNSGNVDSCTFVPKEEAWEAQLATMTEAQQELFRDSSKPIPLPDGYKVTVKEMDSFDKTVTKLKSIEKVETIRENKDLAEKLVTIRHGVTIVAAAIIAILFAVSLFIISNTIKLTMYARRLEINIMKSVGATDSFVKIPFVVEGIVLGILSGTISLLLVFGVYQFAISQFKDLLATFTMEAVGFGKFALPMLGAFVLVGILSGTFGSLISMRKYLRKEGSEISAF